MGKKGERLGKSVVNGFARRSQRGKEREGKWFDLRSLLVFDFCAKCTSGLMRPRQFPVTAFRPQLATTPRNEFRLEDAAHNFRDNPDAQLFPF
jgi:hypothetical protein